MGHLCRECGAWTPAAPEEHAAECSKTAIPSMIKPLWGLTGLTTPSLNRYTFPDLQSIVNALPKYLDTMNQANPTWPKLHTCKRITGNLTDPGMVLMLGNPVNNSNGQIECEIMNGKLPIGSYRTIHEEYAKKNGNRFIWTKTATAQGFFSTTGAIAIMPSDFNYAGDPPANQLKDGGVLVNAHSGCKTGLMVHEIIHCFGGPAGFIGEGLTDWFAIDLMNTSFGGGYDGNPAYSYQTDVVDRLVKEAGKERVARLIFLDKSEFEGLKGKAGFVSVTGGATFSQVFSSLGDWAYDAQEKTNLAAGVDLLKDVPIHATPELEEQAGLGVGKQITKMGKWLNALMK